MSSTIQIRIQGRLYTLRSQQSEDQTHRIVTFVEKKLAETAAGRSVDTIDLMILTLLNLAGEHLQLNEQREREQGDINHALEDLTRRIHSAVDR
ncbi:MAG: cell division protein ZapA [Pelovirga sp.]